MSENSCIRDFSGQAFTDRVLADLTVLRFITTVWTQMSENSYLGKFSAQVSEIVFFADLTVLRFLQMHELNCKKSHISASSVHKYHKSCF